MQIFKTKFYLGRVNRETNKIDILLQHGSFRREMDIDRLMYYVKERTGNELKMKGKAEFKGCLVIKGKRIIERPQRYNIVY